MSRRSVAKRMRETVLRSPAAFAASLNSRQNWTRGQRPMIIATWKQPAVFHCDAGVMSVGRCFHHCRQQIEDLRRQHHIPVLAALRLHDADDLLLTVNVTPRSRNTSLDRSPEP